MELHDNICTIHPNIETIMSLSNQRTDHSKVIFQDAPRWVAITNTRITGERAFVIDRFRRRTLLLSNIAMIEIDTDTAVSSDYRVSMQQIDR